MDTSVVIPDAVDARVGPRGSLENLSQAEIAKLLDTSAQGLYPLFRSCALAVLNAGSESDNAHEIFERYSAFTVQIVRHAWGIKLQIANAPAAAFVDGEMIRGIKEHLFAVLRDVIYTANEIVGSGRLDRSDPASITNAVFHILRNARVLDFKARPNLVVCWGGHSIGEGEYQYTKKVGYELGLRALDVCTGCGPGADEGADEGRGHRPRQAAHRHRPLPRRHRARHHRRRAAQRDRQPAGDHAGHRDAPRGLPAPGARHRRVPGRRRHGRGNPLPARRAARAGQRRTAVAGGADRAARERRLVRADVGVHRRHAGPAALARLTFIMDDPPAVARHMVKAFEAVREFRRARNDSYNFNWLLSVPPALQQPFEPTHASMRALDLRRARPAHELAADLRRAFSGIVAGNVKRQGVEAIARHGPYELAGDAAVMGLLDRLLAAFVQQQRMKLPGSRYRPTYRLAG